MWCLACDILKSGLLAAVCAVLWGPVFAEETAGPLPRERADFVESVEQLEVESLGDALIESGAVEAGSLAAAVPAGEPLVVINGVEQPRAGRWRFAPHLEMQATYNDNIFIRPSDRVADLILTAAPGLAVGYWEHEQDRDQYLDRTNSAPAIGRGVGNFLILDYTAILLGFVKTPAQNAFDQDALFDVRWCLEKLTLGAGTHFQSKSEPDIDVGGRVRRKTLTSKVTASYQLTDRAALEVNWDHELNDPEGFIRTVEWRQEAYLGYQWTPLVRASLGAAVGRVEVEDSAAQVFERILGRLDYESAAKLSLRLRGGVEFRQSDGALGDRMDPVFDLAVRYALAEATLLVLEGFRRVEPAASQPDETYTATGVALRFERTLLAGLHCSVEGGYANAEYTAAPGGESRHDDLFYARAGLLYNFASWGNVGLGYEYRRNESSRALSSFENNQVTLRTTVIY